MLYHCLSKLLNKGEESNNNTKLLLEKYELYCHQFQIRKTEIVRVNKIIPHLDKMIQTIEQELNKKAPPIIPAPLRSIISKEGVQGIISYLSTLKMEAISTDLILLFDALRSALKFSENCKDPILLRIFDNDRENEYAE